MATLKLKGVRKSYGALEVIHGIDLDVADGELVVLVGPSGCGKSTLLRMIAGLERISEGTIAIGGQVVNDREPKDRDIAMVFQNYALYPHMTVFDNMAYGLRNRHTPKDEIEARVNEAARILELEGYLERRPRQLSGGQRQRVAMGRAIVRKPSVFLFDEPLSNLDAKLRVHMRVEIRRLQQALRTTSVYVTHDQVEAMTLADRLVVMNKGVAEQVGSPVDVYERPATTFVASFIGSPAMNFLPVVVDGDGRTLRLGSGQYVTVADRALPSGAITLGLRAEDIKLRQDDFSGGVQLSIQVELVEILGADSVVHGTLAGSGDRLLVRLPGIHRFPAGEPLSLIVSPDRFHFFKENGQRIELQ
jgi:sn-glycerol 3-phosphate transport system ATP-binding protein